MTYQLFLPLSRSQNQTANQHRRTKLDEVIGGTSGRSGVTCTRSSTYMCTLDTLIVDTLPTTFDSRGPTYKLLDLDTEH
ncbi:hypothetical protein AG1IA_04764 [Rhizoctonia solani AG-1 IA]|uniref:Uncharacterized protein n=1 Tax=Thanatephorus cucumeris (strain AG1-IA) TaxID=983506 RepID=L8WWK5_THACA|nr:hypothetical protein AG1IA_04764 [Rhizoctonia solani AG-1 IA]